MFQTLVGGRDGLGIGGAELNSIFRFFVEAHQALGASIAVHVFLREDGAEPAFEGSAASVGSELRNAFAIARVRAVEIGVKSVGEFVGGRVFAGDAERGEIELLAVSGEENFPGGVVTLGAGAGEGELVDAQAQEEDTDFGFGTGRGGVLLADLAQDRGEGFAAKFEFLAGALCVELRQEIFEDGLHCGKCLGSAHSRVDVVNPVALSGQVLAEKLDGGSVLKGRGFQARRNRREIQPWLQPLRSHPVCDVPDDNICHSRCYQVIRRTESEFRTQGRERFSFL